MKKKKIKKGRGRMGRRKRMRGWGGKRRMEDGIGVRIERRWGKECVAGEGGGENFDRFNSFSMTSLFLSNLRLL